MMVGGLHRGEAEVAVLGSSRCGYCHTTFGDSKLTWQVYANSKSKDTNYCIFRICCMPDTTRTSYIYMIYLNPQVVLWLDIITSISR